MSGRAESITIKERAIDLNIAQLRAIFRSNGIEENTKDEILLWAMTHGTHVALAYDTGESRDGILIGIARSMDDGAWNANIDCLAVHRDYQGRGIGRLLMESMMRQLRHCECVCIAPEDGGLADFYEDLGFRPEPGSRSMRLIRSIY